MISWKKRYEELKKDVEHDKRLRGFVEDYNQRRHDAMLRVIKEFVEECDSEDVANSIINLATEDTEEDDE